MPAKQSESNFKEAGREAERFLTLNTSDSRKELSRLYRQLRNGSESEKLRSVDVLGIIAAEAHTSAYQHQLIGRIATTMVRDQNVLVRQRAGIHMVRMARQLPEVFRYWSDLMRQTRKMDDKRRKRSKDPNPVDRVLDRYRPPDELGRAVIEAPMDRSRTTLWKAEDAALNHLREALNGKHVSNQRLAIWIGMENQSHKLRPHLVATLDSMRENRSNLSSGQRANFRLLKRGMEGPEFRPVIPRR
ncbi:hypothetical protein KJ765_02305 [Candidatus Micrarchaeota archaeon]|nr:hypothetical protein [Candidatus Micrarchaeota archaeon]